jgi:hypothetical protein
MRTVQTTHLGGCTMKKIARFLLATLLLVGTVSITSLADGGSPMPPKCPSTCKP